MQEKRYTNYQAKGAMELLRLMKKATEVQAEITEAEENNATPQKLATLMLAQMQIAEKVTELTRNEADGYDVLSRYIAGCTISEVGERIR